MPNIEAIAFNEDHARYQAQEAAKDRKAVWIEDRVNQLMRQGEEYYPFTPGHVQEAIAELELADTMLLGAHVATAFNLPDNDSAKIHLADFITDRVQDYWHACAVIEAEKEYDKKEF